MVYVCRQCRLVSIKKYTCCPHCGLLLTEDDRSPEEWEQQGYRVVGKKKPQAQVGQNPSTQKASRPVIDPEPVRSSSPNGHTAPAFHVDDGDYLNDLRRNLGIGESPGPSATRQQACQNETPLAEPTEEEPFFRRTAPQGAHNSAQRQPTEPQPSVGARRRASVGEESPGDAEVPFFRRSAPDPRPRPAPSSQGHPEGIRPETEHRGRSRRSFRLSDFWNGLGNFFRLIPWRAVLLLLVILAIIGVVMHIWSLRYAIVAAVLGFLIELIPVGLIIGGIIYLLRQLGR